MVTDTLSDQSRETHNSEVLCNALKLIGEMDVKTVRDDGWFDDQYYADYNSEYEMQSDEGWMDDLDEAA
jgi:hypothetical protein